MTSTTGHANPWDRAFNTGLEWQDELVADMDGKPVHATCALSPAGPKFMRVLFPDGSIFYFGFDAAAPIGRARPGSEMIAAEIAEASDAFQVWAPLCRSLYDKASLTEIDTDL